MAELLIALGLLGSTLTYSLPPAKSEPHSVLVGPQSEGAASASAPNSSLRPDLEVERPAACERTLARKATRYGTIRIGAGCQLPAMNGSTGS
jgi:hypothetical protein